jgi:hypothetical protein
MDIDDNSNENRDEEDDNAVQVFIDLRGYAPAQSPVIN